MANAADGGGRDGIEPDGAPLRLKLDRHVEVSLHRSRLSGDLPEWSGQSVRLWWAANEATHWVVEIARQRRYDDDGMLFALGATHVLNEDWYVSAFAASSDGGFFLPRSRLDAFINRKWLAKRNLVTTLGAGYYQAKDVHHDRSLFLGLAYYFDAPWIVEGGARLNRSYPGAVSTARGFVAVTEGRDRQHFATLRYEAGKEGYLLVGEQNALNDFSSRQFSFTWRQWLTRDNGLMLRAERYMNWSYSRNSLDLGFFWGL